MEVLDITLSRISYTHFNAEVKQYFLLNSTPNKFIFWKLQENKRTLFEVIDPAIRIASDLWYSQALQFSIETYVFHPK